MVQLECQLQHGDRCLCACVMVCDKIAACQSLLAQSILHYTRLICLVEQEIPKALEEAIKVMELLKHSGQNMVKADKALEDALRMEVEVHEKNP